MLSVTNMSSMLSVVMLSVVAPFETTNRGYCVSLTSKNRFIKSFLAS